MEILATAVDVNFTHADAQNHTEIWATDAIDVRSHVIVINAMKEYCGRVHPNFADKFQIRVFRERGAGEAGHVRFGAALLAQDDVFSTLELQELKRGVAQLTRRIADPNSLATPDLLEDETTPISPFEQAAVLNELKRIHGGHRLERPLQLRIADHALVQVKTQILQHPDMPAEELPHDFIGTVARCDFDSFNLHVSINPATGIKGAKSTKVKLGCADLKLFAFCTNAGLERKALRFQVRKLEETDGRISIELERAMHVGDGDAAPLFS